MLAARKWLDPNGARGSLAVRIGAVILIVSLAAGCHGQLAQKHDFFAPGGAAGTRSQTETLRYLAYYQALQAAQHRCLDGGHAGASRDGAPSDAASAGGPPGREPPWALPCPGADDSHAAHGSTSNSFRRWVEDQVRPLPAPSETASSIGSGS